MKSEQNRKTQHHNSHNQMVKCGKCGKKGHNRRTCGKTPQPHLPYTQPLNGNPSPALTFASLPSSTKNTPQENTISGAVERLPDFPNNSTSSTNNGLYTVEDLETLWEIQSGRYGIHVDDMGIVTPSKNMKNIATQWENEDTLKLVELVHTMTTPDDIHISVKQWKQFLYKFSNNARASFVAGFRKTCSFHEKPNFPQYILPPQIFYALHNDSYSQVRVHLARSLGIPEEVALKFIDDHHPDVLVETLRNPDITGKVLDKALRMLNKLEEETQSPQPWVSWSRGKGWAHAIGRAHKAISIHPSLTQKIIHTYKERDDATNGNYSPYGLTISNPNVDATLVTEVFTQAMKKRDMAQSELETMERTPPPRSAHNPTQRRENELEGEIRTREARLRSATSNPNLPAHLFTQFVNPERYIKKTALIHHTQFSDPRISTQQCEQYATELARSKQWDAVKSLIENPNINEKTKKFLLEVLTKRFKD